jgi:hypothetical protein
MLDEPPLLGDLDLHPDFNRAAEVDELRPGWHPAPAVGDPIDVLFARLEEVGQGRLASAENRDEEDSGGNAGR